MHLRAPSLLLLALAVQAAEIHVTTGGSDQAAGTASHPLRTLQAAADRAKPGDTVLIHGGTWRESVVPPTSGTPDAPITFAAAPGERPVIDGTDPVAGWSEGADGISVAPMPGDWFSRATPGDGVNLYDARVHNQADQVFVDGRMMILARWPNSPTLDPSFPGKAVTEKFISKSRDQATNWTTGTLVDDQLDLPPSAVVGAQIMIQPNWGAWAWLLTGRITALDGHRFTYQSRNDGGKDFSQNVLDDRSRYVLFDSLGLLDAPGEWWHDKAAGRLHLKSPDGKPLEGRVTAKRREYAFDLSNRSHIILRGLTIRACTITTDRDSGGDNIGFDEAGKSRYPWRNAAAKLPTEPWHQIAAYRDAPSQGIVLEDLDATYVSHFTDVSGHFFGQWGQSSGIVLSGRGHRIAGCRIRYSAGNGITLLGREHRALGNVIEDTGYAANDCGAVHTGVTGRCSSDHEIGWNTIRRTGRSAVLPRAVYRSDPADGSPWKARIHHNDISGFGIQDWDQGGIYAAEADSRYLRVDHNWIHDTHPAVDDLPGAGAFSASGIYPDYMCRWLIDHNAIWNVEWGIHLQNEREKGAHGQAGYVVRHNSIAVRSFNGGKPQPYGPFGVVKNSNSPFKGTVVADNLILLTDGSKGFKPVDFASEAANGRVVDNNVTGTDPRALGLTGGDAWPLAFVPTASASALVDRVPARPAAAVDGLTPPAHEDPAQGAAPDIGAFEAGLPLWAAGHEAWPEGPAAREALARAEAERQAAARRQQAAAAQVQDEPAAPDAPLAATPSTTTASGPSRGLLAAIAAAAGLLLVLVIVLATRKDRGARRERRR